MKKYLLLIPTLICLGCPHNCFGQLIAGGGQHSLQICNNDPVKVLSFGANGNGQLGNNSNTNSNTPVFTYTNGVAATSVSAGSNHSLSLKMGNIYAWGQNTSGQLGVGTNVDHNTPVWINSLTGIIKVAAGYQHSIAVKSNETLWAWGANGSGQLGDGTTTAHSSPVQVTGFTGTTITAIAGGDQHSLALIDGIVWAWGENGSGQLGDGTTTDHYTPVQITSLTGVTAIAAGEQYSLALKNDGTVWAWGDNTFGQLGDGTNTSHNTPVQVSGFNGAIVIAIAAGGHHSLALKNDGTVWAWGDNTFGQLGDGTNTSHTTPVQVSGFNGVTITAIAAGIQHSLALKNNGTVWTWGDNTSGQLGDGTNTSHTVPVAVIGGLCSGTVLQTYPTVVCGETTVSYNCNGNSPTDFWYAIILPSGYSGAVLTINTLNSGSATVYGPFQTLPPIQSFNSPCSNYPFSSNLTISCPFGSCNAEGYYVFDISLNNTPCPLQFILELECPNLCNYEPLPCDDCLPSFAPQPDSTYIISAWISQDMTPNTMTFDISNSSADPFLTVSFNGSNGTDYHPSGQIIDGWQRLEGEFTVPSNATQFSLIVNNGSATDAWFDDIRIYPKHGSMKTYVFDPITLRLDAELDERNYATIYEYDEEGHLTRVKKETERGVMTIQENKTASSK